MFIYPLTTIFGYFRAGGTIEVTGEESRVTLGGGGFPHTVTTMYVKRVPGF